MNNTEITRGDDITISGTVEAVEGDHILLAVKAQNGVTYRHWISPAEVKARRPGGWNGRTREAWEGEG